MLSWTWKPVEQVGRRGRVGPVLLGPGDPVVVAGEAVAVDLHVGAGGHRDAAAPVPTRGAESVAVDPVVADGRVLADLVEDPLRPVALDQVVLDERVVGVDVGPEPLAVVVVDVSVADGDLPDVPLHAPALELAGGAERVVAGQLRPVQGGRIAVQPVQDDPGGRVAADPQLVVVVVVATEDPHAVGDQEARPGVVQGRHVADQPTAGTGIRLDGCALPAAFVVPHRDRVQGHVARPARERRREAPSAVQHRARLPAERVTGLRPDAEVPQVDAGLDDVGGAGWVRVHHALGVVPDADRHTASGEARRGGQRRLRRCGRGRLRRTWRRAERPGREGDRGDQAEYEAPRR